MSNNVVDRISKGIDNIPPELFAELKKKIIDNLDARDRLDNALTPEQVDAIKKIFGPGKGGVDNASEEDLENLKDAFVDGKSKNLWNALTPDEQKLWTEITGLN